MRASTTVAAAVLMTLAACAARSGAARPGPTGDDRRATVAGERGERSRDEDSAAKGVARLEANPEGEPGSPGDREPEQAPATSGANAQGDPVEAKTTSDLVARARSLVRAGKLGEARDALRAAKGKKRHGPLITIELARIEARLGNAAEARAGLAAIWKPAAGAGPLEVEVRIALALALRDLGDPKAALAAIGAVDRAQTDRRVAVIAAELARETGDRARAHSIVEALLDRDPRDADAWAALARLLLDDAKPTAARYVVDRALREGIDGAPLHAVRGDAALAEGEPESAALHWARAIQIDPGDASSAMRLGLLRLEHGDVAGSIGPLEAAAAQWPRNVEIRLALAAAARLRRDPKRAAEILDEALAIAPNDARLLAAALKIYDEELEQPARAKELRRRLDAVKLGDAP